MKPVRKLLKAKDNSEAARRLYDRARASSMMLYYIYSGNVDVNGDLLGECELALGKIWRDKSWIADFRDPARVKKSLTFEMRQVIFRHPGG